MLKVLGLSAAFALSAFSAQAASLSLQELITEFNVISKGGLDSTSHVHGRGYVGGDLTGQSEFGSRTPAASVAGGNMLVVEGDIVTGVNIMGSEDVVVGNDVLGTINMNGSGHAYAGGNYGGSNPSRVSDNQSGPSFENRFPEIDFSEIDHAIQSIGSLGGSAARISGDSVNRQMNFDLVSMTGGISVYNVSLADISMANYKYDIGDMGGADQVVINVSGDAATASFLAQATGMATNGARNILWNFYEFTGELTLGRQIAGTVLAPFARVNVNSNVQGSLLAAEIQQRGGEIHMYNFGGDLDEVRTTPVPLPAGLPLLLAGLGGLGIVARRRRR